MTVIRDEYGLTARQREALVRVIRHLLEKQCFPSLSDLEPLMGMASKSGSLIHLNALARKGWIEREERSARGIRLRGCRLRLVCDDSAEGRRLAALLRETGLLEEENG